MDEDEKIYGVDDIRRILKLGRNSTYDFLEDVYKNTHYFKIFKIGKLYRIPKKSFDQWLNQGL